MAKVENLKLLFYRPKEPSFMPKGPNNSVFEAPLHFKTEKYQKYATQLSDRFGEDSNETIHVKNISIPNLDQAMELGRNEVFSLWVPSHRKMAKRLIDVFMAMRSIEDLQSVAVYARERTNPYLFNYALSVALLHRSDTKGTSLPSFVESFPDKFVDSAIFSKAREVATVVPDGSRTPIIIPKDYTATDLDTEHRVAYFREDPGINLHHWHWHLVYPFDAADVTIVNKDRRGELFYYMHEQIMARYNTERLCNGLQRTAPFGNLRQEIVEGYFPKLDSLVASRAWPPRFANSALSDLNRPVDRIKQDIHDLELWRDKIEESISEGAVTDARNRRIVLSEEGGIDILGNMVESSILSPNRNVYGDYHNMGHIFFSFVHDPDHRNLENFGVIGDSATAMRDPIFYRWHQHINDIFVKFKGSLPRYDVDRLNYQGVSLTGIDVVTSGSAQNSIQTFWQRSSVDMSRGLDFTPRGNVFIEFTHLQHKPYTYNIKVNNTGAQRQGTCRIFIAPKTNERNVTWLFRDQRHMFIELDKFTVNLRQGANTIVRRSDESSVTIPFERTFRNLEINRPQDPNSPEAAAFDICGCGWPQHMLIPKGRPEGMAFQLFVMISNIADDAIPQAAPSGQCSDAASYCGLRDRKYPDKRSMGYPFDREPRDGVDTLAAFIQGCPNMGVRDLTVKFNDTVIPRGQNPNF